jgi:hypothetical protein
LTMKEYPESNYFLSVSALDESTEPELGQLLPRTYRIEVNRVIAIVIIPWLSASPWPPPYPTDWEHWRDRDEAAAYRFATHTVTVAPTDEPAPRIQTVIFDEYPDAGHTVFWLPRASHEALLVDIERAYNTSRCSELRLQELDESRPLPGFLRRELPRASLSAYERKILCLPPADEAG